MLMIEAARSFGLAARFASGYLAVPLDDPEEPTSGSARGSTHAWAQIYLPGTGWIDFDPTSGSVGKIGLVTVAVVRDPHHAIPLHGTFFGFLSDHLYIAEERTPMSQDNSAIARLRARLGSDRPAIAMAAHNPLAAKLAAEAGFDAIWGSGFELSASYAVPDANILSVDTHLDLMRAMREVQDAPVIADIARVTETR